MSKPMMGAGSVTAGSGHGVGGSLPSSCTVLGDGVPRDGMLRAGPPDDEREFRPGARASDAPARPRRGAMARTVVSEVVPRLVLAHRDPAQAPKQARPAPPRPVRAREVAAFAHMLLSDDVPGAEAAVSALRGRGVALEQVCLDLMAPAARIMGQAWLDDTSDYTEVTLGMWRMQAILRRLDAVFQPQSDPARGNPRRALVTVVPGATHTFGTDMVAGFLRRAGWEVCNEPVASERALAALVRGGRFAVVGLSAGCSADLRALAGVIAAIRRATARQPAGILIGGSIVGSGPDGKREALRFGGDAVAVDARHAVQQAEGLLALLVKRT